jgi:ubiquinone biosynthesis protein
MLDSLFAITRDFDMQTQPHLLLLQKTMVMVEGIATSLNPSINMWNVAAPYVGEWIRGELGPEAMLADGLRKQADTLKMIPDLIRRLDEQLPVKAARPNRPPYRPSNLFGNVRARVILGAIYSSRHWRVPWAQLACGRWG